MAVSTEKCVKDAPSRDLTGRVNDIFEVKSHERQGWVALFGSLT